jgi:aminodeoxyfutalosine deaminase
VEIDAPALIVAADWFFPITAPPLSGGGALLEKGRVRAVAPLADLRIRHPDTPVLSLPPGAVMPGVINAHTHLELASLDRIPAGGGFTGWVARLTEAKEALDPDTIERGVRQGAADLKRCGTVCVADIANTFPTAPILAEEGLGGIVFTELIGTDPALLAPFAAEKIEEGRGGIATLPSCHTPFSCSAALLTANARLASDRGTPWTLHLAESADEVALLQEGKGPLVDFLRSRGRSEEEIPRPALHPVFYAESIGCLDESLIAVHLVQTGEEEIALLARRGVRPCLCPSSNLHLAGGLPPVSAMLEAGLRPALGTDSPASADSLNLFGEMEILLDSGVEADTILKMATLFGAEALRLGADFGRIEKGNRPALIHLAFDGAAGTDPAAAAIRAGTGRTQQNTGGAITPVQNFVDNGT